MTRSRPAARLALVTFDGSRVAVDVVVSDGAARRTVRRASSVLMETGDASLGMAIWTALTWHGTEEPYDGPWSGVTVQFGEATYRLARVGKASSTFVPEDVSAARLGAAVASLLVLKPSKIG